MEPLGEGRGESSRVDACGWPQRTTLAQPPLRCGTTRDLCDRHRRRKIKLIVAGASGVALKEVGCKQEASGQTVLLQNNQLW